MNLTELLASELEREAGQLAPRAAGNAGRQEGLQAAREVDGIRLSLGARGDHASWIALGINRDELDLNPPGGSQHQASDTRTRVRTTSPHMKKRLRKRRPRSKSATEDHLMKPWRLLVAGNVVSETPRHEMLRDAINHLAHHRGQMTVYLRLLGAKVPAIYGPSADDRSSFG